MFTRQPCARSRLDGQTGFTSVACPSIKQNCLVQPDIVKNKARQERTAHTWGWATKAKGRSASHVAKVAELLTRNIFPLPDTTVIDDAPTDIEYDAVVVGGGMGGLAAAAKLVAQGAKVVVLEKYLVPGGSSAVYQREGYTFDVGSSMMFGMGNEGTTNLITKALEVVNRRLNTIPDPTQVHYHLPSSSAHPDGLNVRVWRSYRLFLEELCSAFPKEREGIYKFYDECWGIFNSLNVLELKSLEEPRYLLGQFFKHPIACLRLLFNVATNTGDIARKYITDPELLKFIDIECYIWSTVNADMTPLINAGMVFCDRHFGGINYPVGGVGRIAQEMVEGIREYGGHVVYKANVKQILIEGTGETAKAVGVKLADGRVFRGKSVISNATRWDTFGSLIPEEATPESEHLFRQRFKKSPSFLTLHLGVREDLLPPGTDVHHIILESWEKMYEARGVIFISAPTMLDRSLSPPGTHILHVFTPEWMETWAGMTPDEYDVAKNGAADEVIDRLESIFPGVRDAIVFREVATPRTHRRYLSREDGTYGPIPSRRPLGMMSMPFNSTSISGLYCTGDSTFPGQGVNAVVFSGMGAAHRIAVDLGMEEGWPVLDLAFSKLLRYVRDRS